MVAIAKKADRTEFTIYGLRNSCRPLITVQWCHYRLSLHSWTFLCSKHLAGTTRNRARANSTVSVSLAAEWAMHFRLAICMSISLCLIKTFWRCPIRFFVRFVAKRYILQQKCLKRWIGSCVLGTRRCNF